MRFEPRRMQQRRRGFRATLSAGWFVYDTREGRWISGPYDHKGRAAAECRALQQEVTAHDQELNAMTTPRKDEDTSDKTGTGSKPADTPKTPPPGSDAPGSTKETGSKG